MFCSPKCKNKYHQSYDSQKNRGLARKIELVKIAGGRCSICGYHKNLALGLPSYRSRREGFQARYALVIQPKNELCTCRTRQVHSGLSQLSC